MTIWDDIYKNYEKGGQAWATLSEEIHPLFKEFLSKSNFERKHVLDIGCGVGKYLQILQTGKFTTDGIDSSESAVEMTKKILDKHSSILCVNMFDFQIPKNTYDLIISISTLHHGTKEQVQNLIYSIYDAIVEKGKIFITVPHLESAIQNRYLEDTAHLGNNTYVPTIGPEKGLPHSYYTKQEAQILFSKFRDVQIDLDEIGRLVVQGAK